MIAYEVAEDDADLLDRIARHDPGGVSLLYDRYGGIAFSLAYRILRDRQMAEDIVQEAFLNVWRRGGTYEVRRGTVRAWLLTIVHHQTIDVVRAQRARGGVAADIDALPARAGDQDIAATVVTALEGERVRRALLTLPVKQRQVIELAYFGGQSQSEIAFSIAVPIGTVKGRMRLALEKLHATLQQGEAIEARAMGGDDSHHGGAPAGDCRGIGGATTRDCVD